jgi:hypothetical protein
MLLELFRLVSHDELYAVPRSDRVVQLIRQLPADSATYEHIAEEGFRTFLADSDEPTAIAFERLVDILTVLLYDDGRTFVACLRIAELSNERPAYGVFGVNALAGIANYMRRGRPLPMPKRELLKKFEAFENNDDLTHNAGECRKMLIKAYTDGRRK